MRSAKVISLVISAISVALAFVGPSSAMGEGSTALCKADELTCAAAKLVTHLHQTSVGKVKLLSSLPTIECNALFLGDALNGGLGNPLVFHGHFTFTNCNNFCSVSEVAGTDSLKLYLRLGSHLADVTYHYEVHKVCPFINCTYSAVGLEGHVLDPLLGEENGSEAVSEQESQIVSGSCPEEHFVDATFTSLERIYISS